VCCGSACRDGRRGNAARRLLESSADSHPRDLPLPQSADSAIMAVYSSPGGSAVATGSSVAVDSPPLSAGAALVQSGQQQRLAASRRELELAMGDLDDVTAALKVACHPCWRRCDCRLRPSSVVVCPCAECARSAGRQSVDAAPRQNQGTALLACCDSCLDSVLMSVRLLPRVCTVTCYLCDRQLSTLIAMTHELVELTQSAEELQARGAAASAMAHAAGDGVLLNDSEGDDGGDDQ
jgi:hypothetical protein